MLKGVSDIIIAVGKDPRKMWTLVIILIFLTIASVSKTFFATDDCSPLIKQNEDLLHYQSELINENQKTIKTNQDLLNGYLELQKLIANMKPDTVYITKTVSTQLTKNDLHTLIRVENMYSGVGDTGIKATSHNLVKLDMMPKKVVIKTDYSKANETIMDKVNDIIYDGIKKCKSLKK